MMRQTSQSLLAVSMFATLVAPLCASAAEMQWKATSYIATPVDAKSVGDVEGHVKASYGRRGLCLLPKEVGVYDASVSFEVTNGKGAGTGAMKCTFEDGSSFELKTTYDLSPLPNGNASLTNGRAEFTGGTGRFAGIKGTTTLTGRTYTPRSETSKSDLLLNCKSKYTVTKKPVAQK